jgi:hypothetical protein
VRVELAVKECRARLAADKKPSFRALGRRYSIDWSRIRDRINQGQGTRKDYAQARQRLTPAKELVLEGWCKQLKK